jgi:hypothetical protein
VPWLGFCQPSSLACNRLQCRNRLNALVANSNFTALGISLYAFDTIQLSGFIRYINVAFPSIFFLHFGNYSRIQQINSVLSNTSPGKRLLLLYLRTPSYICPSIFQSQQVLFLHKSPPQQTPICDSFVSQERTEMRRILKSN